MAVPKTHTRHIHENSRYLQNQMRMSRGVMVHFIDLLGVANPSQAYAGPLQPLHEGKHPAEPLVTFCRYMEKITIMHRICLASVGTRRAFLVGCASCGATCARVGAARRTSIHQAASSSLSSMRTHRHTLLPAPTPPTPLTT